MKRFISVMCLDHRPAVLGPSTRRLDAQRMAECTVEHAVERKVEDIAARTVLTLIACGL
jgi:hypothetical protein